MQIFGAILGFCLAVAIGVALDNIKFGYGTIFPLLGGCSLGPFLVMLGAAAGKIISG